MDGRTENMSETNTNEAGSFEPRPIGEILRSEPETTRDEPAGRPEPTAATQATSNPGDMPATTGDRPRDDAGRFAPRGEQQEAPPASEQKPPQMVPLSTALEERKKRQALEARLAEMEARMRAPQPPAAPQQPAQPEVPLSDLMFQDPDRFIQAVRAPLEEQLVHTRIAMSEQVARQAPDYEQAEAAFIAFAESDPQTKAQIAAELRRHPTPALWALEVGRKVLAQQQWGQVIQQYGSPDAYLAAVRQQQPPAPVASTAPAVPSPPASLASVRSAGPRSAGGPAWNGPRPLSAILGTRR